MVKKERNSRSIIEEVTLPPLKYTKVDGIKGKYKRRFMFYILKVLNIFRFNFTINY